MIKVKVIRTGGCITGFDVSGHSGYSEAGSDIICASVSSAAYMTANTVTDILSLNPVINEKDGSLSLSLRSDEAEKARDILEGFALHIKELAKQYPDYIILERGA